MSTGISVVIPTCDWPGLLLEAVNCVLDQSCPAHEIIVVNNGGKPLDESRLPRPVQLCELPPYAGVSRARNQGVTRATGDYVAFLDDDDLWELNYLEKLAAVIEEQHPDCIVTRLDTQVDGQIVPYKNAAGKLNLANLLVRNPGTSGSSTVVRREPFFQVSGYDPELKHGEDTALIIDLLIKGYSIVAAPHIQAIMRGHAGPCLRDARSRPDSIGRFLQKYGKLMSWSQRNYNFTKFYYRRYHTQGHPLDLYQYWFRFQIHRFIRKLDPTLPSAPRLPKHEDQE